MATGIVLLVVALFVFLRTVRGTPRLADVLMQGKAAAIKAGATS